MFLYDWNRIKNNFEIYLLFTPFIFAGGFSFNFAMHVYVLYENCKRYEMNPFNTGGGGNSSDFLWMMIIGMIMIMSMTYFFPMEMLADPIVFYIVYVWSRRSPDTQLSIYGLKLKSLYLPWAFIAIRLIMGGSIVEPLIGIACGHIYYFLVDVLPLSHGYDIIRTPKFCINIAEWYTGNSIPASTGYRGTAGGFRVGNNNNNNNNNNTNNSGLPAPGRVQSPTEPRTGTFPQMGAGHTWVYFFIIIIIITIKLIIIYIIYI